MDDFRAVEAFGRTAEIEYDSTSRRHRTPKRKRGPA